MKRIVGAIASLFITSAAVAQTPAEPSPALGQIVNWKFIPQPSVDFNWGQNAWTPSNASMVFNKLYNDSVIRCDVMLDAETTTTGAVYAGLFVEGNNRMAQALTGAPTQPSEKGLITLGFSNLIGGLAAGNHNFVVNVAVEDNSTVTFLTTELGIQCYVMLLPRQR